MPMLRATWQLSASLALVLFVGYLVLRMVGVAGRPRLATLQSFGVRLSDADRLDAAVVKVLEPSASQPAAGEAVPTDAVVHPDRVITAETVHAMAPGSKVTLMPNAIITDLARDAARQGRITLSRRS